MGQNLQVDKGKQRSRFVMSCSSNATNVKYGLQANDFTHKISGLTQVLKSGHSEILSFVSIGALYCIFPKD